MAGRLITVGGAVLGEVRGPSRKSSRGNWLAQRRLGEMHALLRLRHGGAPAGTPYWVRPLVDLLVWTAREAGRVLDAGGLVERVELICPEIDREGLSRTIALALECPRRWTAAELGHWLGLTLIERQALSIRTIRAAGDTPARAAARKRKADRQRAMAKRRSDGAQPRAEYLAASAAAEARRLGVSERTIRRRRKAENVRSASPICSPTFIRDIQRTFGRFQSVSPAAAILFDRAAQALRRPLRDPDPPLPELTPGALRLLELTFSRFKNDDRAAGRR